MLNDELFPQVPDLHLDFRFRSQSPSILLTDHLQIHLLELPKYSAPADNEVITDPIEKWAYFFRHVKELTPEEVSRHVPGKAFAEATGVLQMIQRSPEERTEYEARLKMRRDEESRTRAAVELAEKQAERRGEERGEERGVVIGEIRMLQRFLGLSVVSTEQLSGLPTEKLEQLRQGLDRDLEGRV